MRENPRLVALVPWLGVTGVLLVIAVALSHAGRNLVPVVIVLAALAVVIAAIGAYRTRNAK